MSLEVDDLRAIRMILRTHGIERAWLLETDPTELIVMLHLADLKRVNSSHVEAELISGLVPHRKVWLAEVQTEVAVQGSYQGLDLIPAFGIDD